MVIIISLKKRYISIQYSPDSTFPYRVKNPDIYQRNEHRTLKEKEYDI